MMAVPETGIAAPYPLIACPLIPMTSPGRRLGSLMVRFLPAALLAGAAGLAVAQAPAVPRDVLYRLKK